MSDPASVWQCATCTLFNAATCPACLACQRPRPYNLTAAKPKKKKQPSSSSTATAKPAKKKKKTTPPSSPTTKKPKYRQPQELSDGTVEILCFKCRRDPSNSVQKSVQSFFVSSSGSSPTLPTVGQCARCLKPMNKPTSSSASSSNSPKKKALGSNLILPHIARLRTYKKLASDALTPFTLTDAEATSIMRQPCFLCG
jgi:hypothetical protein